MASNSQDPIASASGSALDQLATNARSSFKAVAPAALQKFLEAQPDVNGPVHITNVEELRDGAGASNGIAFFEASIAHLNDGEPRRYVLRYNPGFQLLKQKSYAHEYLTMQAAYKRGLPVPKVYWLDADGTFLGTPGYICEEIDGQAPAASVYGKGLLANATPEERRNLLLSAAEFHGNLRKMQISPAEVPHLLSRGSGPTPIQRELSWWLREAELAEPSELYLDAYRASVSWAIARQPSSYAPNLVHGDAQFANIMFKDGEIAAVLDWELSFLGHNESDLALVVFLAQMNPDDLPGVPTEQEFVETYERASGYSVSHWEFFKFFNLLKFQGAVLLTSRYNPAWTEQWESFAGLISAAQKDAEAHR